MNNSIGNQLFSKDDKLYFDLWHEVALDTYFSGLIAQTTKYKPHVVRINDVEFKIDSPEFLSFQHRLATLPPEFNFAMFHLAKIKIRYNPLFNEELNIRIDIDKYINSLFTLGDREEVIKMTNAVLTWRDLLEKQCNKIASSNILTQDNTSKNNISKDDIIPIPTIDSKPSVNLFNDPEKQVLPSEDSCSDNLDDFDDGFDLDKPILNDDFNNLDLNKLGSTNSDLLPMSKDTANAVNDFLMKLHSIMKSESNESYQKPKQLSENNDFQ